MLKKASRQECVPAFFKFAKILDLMTNGYHTGNTLKSHVFLLPDPKTWYNQVYL